MFQDRNTPALLADKPGQDGHGPAGVILRIVLLKVSAT